MTKKLQNKKGFTLTELIVVIVIIGILAAVLIPTLTGYITRANQSAAEQEALQFVTPYQTWLAEGEDDADESGEYTNDFIAYSNDLVQLAENATITINKDADGNPNGFTYKAKNGFKVTWEPGKGITESTK